MENKPQNSEFWNNPENFHLCALIAIKPYFEFNIL